MRSSHTLLSEDELLALAQASEVSRTLGTEGWKTIRKILEERIDEWADVENVSSLKEMLANKATVKCLRKFLKDLDSINQSYDAKIREVNSQSEIEVEDLGLLNRD